MLIAMLLLGLVTFAAMFALVALCEKGLTAMTLVALILSGAAFLYLLYAMLRPEKF